MLFIMCWKWSWSRDGGYLLQDGSSSLSSIRCFCSCGRSGSGWDLGSVVSVPCRLPSSARGQVLSALQPASADTGSGSNGVSLQETQSEQKKFSCLLRAISWRVDDPEVGSERPNGWSLTGDFRSKHFSEADATWKCWCSWLIQWHSRMLALGRALRASENQFSPGLFCRNWYCLI